MRLLLFASVLLPGLALGVPVVQPSSSPLQLPELPVCVEQEHNAFYQEFWDQFRDSEAVNKECSEPVTVLMPSNAALLALFPLGSTNPFFHEAVLQHLTVFSHVILGSLEPGSVMTSLNGRSVGITETDGEIFANGLKVSDCGGVEDKCLVLKHLDGILGVTKEDVDFALAHPVADENAADVAVRGGADNEAADEDDAFVFPTFEMPYLTDEVKEALSGLDAAIFTAMWEKLLQEMDTIPLNIEEMMILVPTDSSLRRLIPELKPGLGNPLLEDLPLMKHIVANHIILKEGVVPQRLLDSLQDQQQIVKVNMKGKSVVFHREEVKGGNTVLKANGDEVISISEAGRAMIYEIPEVFYTDSNYIDDAIARMAAQAGEENPFSELVRDEQQEDHEELAAAFLDGIRIGNHLPTAHVPELRNIISFDLRRHGADRFASIWIDVKERAQNDLSESTGDVCMLPKKIGPCKQRLASFYYNFDTGRCEPFIYGGCEGNENKFDTLLQCSEKCHNAKEKQKLRDLICEQPRYIYETIPFLRKDCHANPKTRYHYDKVTDQCGEFTFSGCLGTDNNFETVEQCRQICQSEQYPSEPEFIISVKPVLPSREERCRFPEEDEGINSPVQVSCDIYEPRWAYNSDQETCAPVFANQCQDQRNLHHTQAECTNDCGHKVANETLVIYAPTSEALEDLYFEALAGQEVLTGDDLLSRKFLLTSLSRHECDANTDRIPSLNPDKAIDCSTVSDAELVVENFNYKVYLVPEVRTITEDELKTAATDSLLNDDLFRTVPDLQSQSLSLVEAKPAPEQKAQVRSILLKASLNEFSDKWDELTGNKEIEYSCFLPPDEGIPCQEGSTQTRITYRYDSEAGFCYPLEYKGCGGNWNNFHTYSACEDFCGQFGGQVAVAELSDELGMINGSVVLSQETEVAPLIVRIALFDLPSGDYKLQFHDFGYGRMGCSVASKKLYSIERLEFSSEGNKVTTFTGKVYGLSLFGNNLISTIEGQSVAIHAVDSSDGPLACGRIVPEVSEKKAEIELVGTNGELIDGVIHLTQAGPDAPVKFVSKDITGLKQGLHGFQIHTYGDTSNDCMATGDSFDPFEANPEERSIPDAGDLGKLFAVVGVTEIYLENSKVSLYEGANNILNRAIVIHDEKQEDNSRLACGFINEVIVPRIATIVLTSPGDDVSGEIKLTQKGPRGHLHITGTVHGLPAGSHGFHIHNIGSTDRQCLGAGGHYNPFFHSHGSPESGERHVGDLGNIVADDSGTTEVAIIDWLTSLYGDYSIVNRSLVIHAKEDDLGQGGHPDSLKTGNAGAREACGVILEENKLSFLDSPMIIFAPLEVQSMTLQKLFCHLALEQYTPGEDQEVETICGEVISIVHEGDKVLVNGKEVLEVLQSEDDGKITVMKLDKLLHDFEDTEEVEEETVANENMKEVVPLPKTGTQETLPKLRIAPLSDSLDALGKPQNQRRISTFFQMWRAFQDSELYEKDTDFEENSPLTIVTVPNVVFNRFIPADAASPYILDAQLQADLLGDMVIYGKVRPDDPALKAPEGLRVESLSGKELIFRKDARNSITVNGESMKELNFHANAVIYVLDDSIAITFDKVRAASQRLEGN